MTWEWKWRLTLNAGEDNPGVVVGDDVGVAVLWFVDLQVGVLPGELLSRVNGLQKTQNPGSEQITGGRRFETLSCC